MQPFFLDTNCYSATINNSEELEVVIGVIAKEKSLSLLGALQWVLSTKGATFVRRYTQDDYPAKSPEEIAAMNRAVEIEKSSDTPSFGYRREHQGDITLAEWLGHDFVEITKAKIFGYVQ